MATPSPQTSKLIQLDNQQQEEHLRNFRGPCFSPSCAHASITAGRQEMRRDLNASCTRFQTKTFSVRQVETAQRHEEGEAAVLLS